jgi:hypothetical protein
MTSEQVEQAGVVLRSLYDTLGAYERLIAVAPADVTCDRRLAAYREVQRAADGMIDALATALKLG